MKESLLASAAAVVAALGGGIWQWGARVVDLIGHALAACEEVSRIIPPASCVDPPPPLPCDCSVSAREVGAFCVAGVSLVGGGVYLGHRLAPSVFSRSCDLAASTSSDGTFSAFAADAPKGGPPRGGGKVAPLSGGSLCAYAVDASLLV